MLSQLTHVFENINFPVFPLFFFILFLMLMFRIKMRQVDKNQVDDEDAFWERENAANNAKAVDPSSLSYIEVPADFLPLYLLEDEETKALSDALCDLSSKKILNLEGKSNTDLKMEYGVSNLDLLYECESNYDLLIKSLDGLATIYHENGRDDEALTLLEYAVGWGSDLKNTYYLLGLISCQKGDYGKVDDLIETASALPSLNKTSIINALNSL